MAKKYPPRILISAALSTPSRAIARSIRLSKRYGKSYLVGTDTLNGYYGLYEGLFNRIYKVPRYTHESYRDVLLKILRDEKIDHALILHELEVHFWAQTGDKPEIIRVPPASFTGFCISKKKLYERLRGTGYVPDYKIIDFSGSDVNLNWEYPFWVRDVSEGSAGGKGAFKIESKYRLKAWKEFFNPGSEIMISEYLPGRNLASLVILENNILRKAGTYERLTYLLSQNSPSGISGQISTGRLLNEKYITDISRSAINKLINDGDSVTGFLTVDYKEDSKGVPKITEINLRPVSAVSSFTQAGFNMVEFYIDILSGNKHLSEEMEHQYPENNLILREVDGLPIWIKDKPNIEMGLFFS
ncbi:MAG: hypothetical protein RBS37_07440 [Bacteroidales bacterium]|jgi:carbamoyl-phosphate synthase large subunit|nr:hypothetical protein [Bacteroidales bacterium]